MYMCKGHSWAVQVLLFPGFDQDDFPYILAKEDYCLTVINAREGAWFKLKNHVYEARPLNQKMLFLNQREFLTTCN